MPNRRSRFRAWIPPLRTWAHDVRVFADGCFDIRTEDMWQGVIGDAVLLSQGTGLKDANGTEIYEGDVMEGGGIRGYVVYHPSGAWGISQQPEPLHGCWFFNDEDTRQRLLNEMVVVGNIYENPELVE